MRVKITGVVAGGVVYCEPSLDIPSEIIKRYDASKELIRKYE